VFHKTRWATLALGFGLLAGVGAARLNTPNGVPAAQAAGQPALKAEVRTSTHHDVSPALRDTPAGLLPTTAPRLREHGLNKGRSVLDSSADGALQTALAPNAMPVPIANFDGTNNQWGYYPPDTNGAVGPSHYVQTVNVGFQIWNKNGTVALGVRNTNVLWAGFGGVCETTNQGDPIVMYDQLSDRWLISQFAFTGSGNVGPFYECVAVSTTGDPTGTYNRYGFLLSNTIFGDYPKFGVWPDAYYMTTNEFDTAGNWAGAGAYAFDRAAMIAGAGTARQVYFHLSVNDWGGMLPMSLEGTTLPPAGMPNTFMEIGDSAWDPGNIPNDGIEVYDFHVDWSNTAASTFTARPRIPVAAFDGVLCSFNSCVPQAGTAQKLDTLADRGMWRLAMRNFGDHLGAVFNHTVDVGTNVSAIRWYELRSTVSAVPSWSIYQQSTYAPDSTQRWMGSMAIDRVGNIGIGFSASSASMSPAIRYSGRLVTDALNTLGQGEATFIAGTGSQTGTAGRWGDYSALTVDPTDDCTLWFTSEYLSTTSTTGWRTRISSFKFPNCTPPVPTATSTATATPTVFATPTIGPGCIFSDVCPSDYFFTPVQYLVNHGVVGGYGDNTFRPFNNTTRGQMSKIVTLGFSLSINTTGGPHFSDVPVTDTFYQYIETAYNAGIIGGFSDGTFKPSNYVTRGQLSKRVVLAAGWTLQNPATGHFTDVPVGSTFYQYVETAWCHAIIDGYTDGTFRPTNNAFRGQVAKLVYLGIQSVPGCSR
jgi:hypothetical protein